MEALAKALALGMVGAVFVYSMKKNWETPCLLFGLVFLIGSCEMLGVK